MRVVGARVVTDDDADRIVDRVAVQVGEVAPQDPVALPERRPLQSVGSALFTDRDGCDLCVAQLLGVAVVPDLQVFGAGANLASLEEWNGDAGTVEVVDGFTDTPIEGAVVVFPETGEKFTTDKSENGR